MTSERRTSIRSLREIVFCGPILMALCTWGGLVAAVLSLRKQGFGSGDFGQYYMSVIGYLRDGLSPYHHAPNGYIYPPLLLLLFAPVVRALPYAAVSASWFWGNLLLLVGSISLIDHTLKDRGWRRAGLWLLPPLFLPLLDSLVNGQVTIVLLALIAGAWAAHRTGRAHLAGSLLATASWIKLYPGLLVLYFFWKRDVRAASAALLSGIALGAVQLAAFGSSLFFGYFRDVLAPLAAYGQYPYYNLSVLGFFQRFVTTDPEVGQLRSLPLWVAVGRWMMIAGLLAATVALTGRARGDETASERLDLKFALVLTTALLVTPTLWLAGMAPLLICYVVVVRTLQARDRPRLIAATLIVSGLLVNFSLWPQYAEPRWSALTLSAGFFGALLLWAALAYSLVGMARVGDAKRLAS